MCRVLKKMRNVNMTKEFLIVATLAWNAGRTKIITIRVFLGEKN